MAKVALVALAALALSSCGQIAEIEAFDACGERIEVEFPQSKGLADENVDDVKGIGETTPSGDFELSALRKDGSPFGCRGNLNERRFDEVTFRGETATPAESENWSY